MGVEDSTYNLEAFEIFIFSVPELKHSVGYIISLGVFSGLLSLFAIKELSLPVLVFSVVSSTLLAGEGIYHIIEKYGRRWSYFLSLVNEILLVSIVTLSSITGILNIQNILWLGIAVIALNSLEVLIITTGLTELTRKLTASLIQPVIFLGIITASNELNNILSSGNLIITSSSLFLVISSAKFNEWLISKNIEIKGLEMSSKLTLSERYEFITGEIVDRPLQKLKIVNEEGSFTFLGPWLHSGLISRIGGGRMSIDIIEKLNEKGQGFFLNTPATHKSDPCKPEISEKIFNEEPEIDELSERASKLLQKDFGEFKFYGRRYGENRIVYIESSKYDDIEVECFEDQINPETDVLVDCHRFEPEADRILSSGTEKSDKFRENLQKFLKELSNKDLHEYRLGFSSMDGNSPIFALNEEVEGESSLVVGYEGNNVTEIERTLEDRLNGDFDNLLVTTTDSHRNPHSMNKNPEPEKIFSQVEKAKENLSEGSAGLKSAELDSIKILGSSYIKMIASFNIAARLFIISLAAIYIYTLIGVWLV